MELQVLHTAADGFRNLLRIGGGQNKHHLFWWFFQRLQQCSFRSAREHVHFVENENAMTTRASESSCIDDVANLLNAVVAGRV